MQEAGPRSLRSPPDRPYAITAAAAAAAAAAASSAYVLFS